MIDDIAEAFWHWLKDTLLRALEPVFCFVTRSLLFIVSFSYLRIQHSSCQRHRILALIGFIIVFTLILSIFYLINN